MASEQLFWQRVAETREWCVKLISTDDLQGSLRSKEFGIPSFQTPFWKCGYDDWLKVSAPERDRLKAAAEDNRRSLVDALSDCRARMLSDTGRHPGTVCQRVTGQRFIVYIPDNNCSDGASACVSDEYFDVDDVPPWDTWLMYFTAYAGQPGKLISWVPPQLTQLVDQAILVNPSECIYWATEEQLFPSKTIT